jgi:DNA-binding NtrC family response regulator
LICATHNSLDSAITNKTFSESLLYQLNSITLTIPPLRDHIEDIPELVKFFVDKQTIEAELPYRHFTVAAQNRLRNYSWPGNVLELRNVIQRILVLGETDDIDVEDVERAINLNKDNQDQQHGNDAIDYGLPLREAREQFERIYLLKKLKETDGNVGQAAKLAGMERTHLYRKLRSLDIDSKQI